MFQLTDLNPPLILWIWASALLLSQHLTLSLFRRLMSSLLYDGPLDQPARQSVSKLDCFWVFNVLLALFLFLFRFSVLCRFFLVRFWKVLVHWGQLCRGFVILIAIVPRTRTNILLWLIINQSIYTLLLLEISKSNNVFY